MQDDMLRKFYLLSRQFLYVEPQQGRYNQESRIAQRIDLRSEMIDDNSRKKNMRDTERKGNELYFSGTVKTFEFDFPYSW